MRRHQDWLGEGRAEFRAATALSELSHHAWCCFTCQQAAEKALKASLEWHQKPRFGHNLLELLAALTDLDASAAVLKEPCARLNRYYIVTRYPDAFPAGIPSDQFTAEDARQATEDAGTILEHVERAVRSPED